MYRFLLRCCVRLSSRPVDSRLLLFHTTLLYSTLVLVLFRERERERIIIIRFALVSSPSCSVVLWCLEDWWEYSEEGGRLAIIWFGNAMQLLYTGNVTLRFASLHSTPLVWASDGKANTCINANTHTWNFWVVLKTTAFIRAFDQSNRIGKPLYVTRFEIFSSVGVDHPWCTFCIIITYSTLRSVAQPRPYESRQTRGTRPNSNGGLLFRHAIYSVGRATDLESSLLLKFSEGIHKKLYVRTGSERISHNYK